MSPNGICSCAGAPPGPRFAPLCPQKDCSLQVFTLHPFAFIKYFIFKRQPVGFGSLKRSHPMGTEESGGWRKARRDGVAALPGPSPLPAARPWPVTPRLGHLHLPLPTFLSLAFLPLAPAWGQTPHHWWGYSRDTQRSAPGHQQELGCRPRAGLGGCESRPRTPRSQVTRLHAAGGPGRRWGMGGTRSSLSPAENSPSPASSHARVPLGEAAAEPGKRAWAGRPPSG